METAGSLRESRANNEAGLGQLEAYIRSRLVRRIRDFNLELRDGGLVLRGQTSTYYAKQLAQHAVMKATDLPIMANEIEVS